MSPAEQRRMQKEIEDKQIDLQFLGNKLQKEVNDRRQELLQQMVPKIDVVLKDLIELEGLRHDHGAGQSPLRELQARHHPSGYRKAQREAVTPMTRQSGSFTLGELAELAGAEVSGDPSERIIRGVGSLASATEGCRSVTFPAPPTDLSWKDTQAGAVILAPEDAQRWSGDALLAANPYLAFARITQKFEVRP